MFDCSNDMIKFHNNKVNLSTAEQEEMRGRRDANRDRVRKGLEKNKKPKPVEFKSQGSYAMRTMVQDDNFDYDIDDGVYFEKAELVGERGAEMSALQARQMVRDAVDDGSFKTPPEVRKNCVRVYYEKGYHVDLPVYRRSKSVDIWGKEIFEYELASADWKKSDARDVTSWFVKENDEQSPDKSNGRQLRRITRLMKKFARSRESWKGSILSGFGITKLVTERYKANENREDESLYQTMKAIRNRLNYNLKVEHPIRGNGYITSGEADPKAMFLRDKLTEALDNLEPLHEPDCTSARARKCWDKVFYTDYFSSLEPTTGNKANQTSGTILTQGLISQGIKSDQPQQKQGGGRYA